MAVKASATVTLSCYRDTQSITRYYKLHSSTASAPSKPTTNPPPSGWTDAEPSYTSGSTNTLYFCDLSVFSDGTWSYSTVSKSSAYEAAKEAYNKAVNAQNSVNEMPNYIASRGENLVTNGTCLLGNNKNFSGFTYDGSETYYAGGSFKVTSTSTYRYTDEYIPVDVSQKYALSYYIKCSNSSARFYDMLIMYDIDKKRIDADHVMFVSGSTTTLAKELKNGDTTVYLTSAAGFNTTSTHYWQQGLTFWNYTNSKGYTYGVETYSRNNWQRLWSDGSAIDKTANTITLDSAWTHGAFPAGTPVSQCSDGNGFSYGNTDFSLSANTWTKKTAYWSGVVKNSDSGKFKEGTAFVKLGWLINYGSSTACDTWLSTVSLTQSANNSEVSKLVSTVDVEYYLSTSATSLSGGSWQTTAPTWVNGKYMWSRTKTTKGDGTVTYKPSANGTCIAGAKGDTGATGATGTGISSITEEYYLSTSKTSQTGGSWTTTPPTWSSGKYVWTRSKIVYTNPSSTVYTTAICDSSWEAVNEVQVGGRNLIVNNNAVNGWVNNAGTIVVTQSYKASDYIPVTPGDTITFQLWTPGSVKSWIDDTYFDSDKNYVTGYNGEYITSNHIIKTYTVPEGAAYVRMSYAWGADYKVKLEKGNKATDWTPAPEDMATAEEVDNAQTAADNAQASADSNSDRITASESEIRQLAEMISMLVTDGNGASMMTQTANGGWTFSMGSIVEALAKAQNDVNTLSGDMSSTNSEITSLKSALYDLGVLADYVIITTYNGQPCIELGEAENAFKLRITNTEIQFADGTTIPAYITNKKLMINSAEVKEEMQFGGFVWKVRSNGNLGLIWKGVDG